MKLLIYSRQDRGIIKPIEQVIAALGDINLEYTRDQQAFKHALRTCYAGETLVVFFVDDKRDMAFLESVGMDFMDIKLVIYFGDKGTDLFVRAYKLGPRMVTGAFDTDDLLLAAVKGILLNLMGTRTIFKG